MIPPLLPSLLVRPVRPLDRVAGARGRHVAHIRINTRKTRWTSKKTGVNANALHAADTCPPTCMFSHAVPSPVPISQSLLLRSYLSSLSLLLASRGAVLAFWPPRFGYLHVQYHLTHGIRRKRVRQISVFFTVSTSPATIMTNSTRTPTCTYIYPLPQHRIVADRQL
jgi:hypothetical protein